jgi:alpha-N-arabinofuranosidase
LVNADPNRPVAVSCSLFGRARGRVAGRVITAPTMAAHNTFDRTEAVVPAAFSDFRRRGADLLIHLPAKSVVTLAIID